MEDIYAIYVETFGQVLSGHIMESRMFSKEYGISEKLAVSIGVQDAKAQSPGIRTKSGFEEELKRLLESPLSQDTGVTFERDS